MKRVELSRVSHRDLDAGRNSLDVQVKNHSTWNSRRTAVQTADELSLAQLPLAIELRERREASQTAQTAEATSKSSARSVRVARKAALTAQDLVVREGERGGTGTRQERGRGRPRVLCTGDRDRSGTVLGRAAGQRSTARARRVRRAGCHHAGPPRGERRGRGRVLDRRVVVVGHCGAVLRVRGCCKTKEADARGTAT